MLTYSDLTQQPHRFAELAGADVLIPAATGEVVLDQPRTEMQSGATIVFMHETIALMRAERAEQLDKLVKLIRHDANIIPLSQKAGSFWDNITVGRASTADIVVDDPAVSNVHADFGINVDDHPVSVQDVGSSNGTYVNRVPLQPHAFKALVNGDCVRFGQSIFYYVTNDSVQRLLEKLTPDRQAR